MTVSRRWLLPGAASLVAVAFLVGAAVHRSAPGSPPAAHASASHASRLVTPLPVIWSRDATWARSVRPLLRRGKLRLADLRGHPVVLNFFASWCDPCRREAVMLAAAARRARMRVVFLGVDVNDYAPDARRFLRLHGVPYGAVRSASSTIKAFGLIGLPETFYLDRDGGVVAVTRGALTSSDLAHAVRRLSSGS